MSDLIRLRMHPDNKTKRAMQQDCEWAADCIEKLEAEVARWKERIDAGVHPNTVDLIALEQTKAES